MSTELNMNETVDTSVVDTVVSIDKGTYESYEQFLSRRTHTMSSMIGFAGSSLGQIDISATSSLDCYGNNAKLLRQALKEIGVRALEAQIQLEKEWMEMNAIHDPTYVGNKYSVEKIDRLTEQLEALKTLAL